MLVKYAFIMFFFLLTAACKTQTSTPSATAAVNQDTVGQDLSDQKSQMMEQMESAKLEYFVIKVPNNEYGYYIMINGEMYIEQKTIPAKEGLHGFKTEVQAEEVAKLVIEKIRQGEMPPTIEVEELKEMGILTN